MRLNQGNNSFPNENFMGQEGVEERIYDYIDLEEAMSDIPLKVSPAYQSSIELSH